MSKRQQTDDLEAARAAVEALEVDAQRIGELADAADAEARDARSDPERLPEASARAAGLRQAHDSVLADLEAAHGRLVDLEAARERREAEAELVRLDARCEQLRADAVTALRAALDAALTRLATVAKLERERRSAHHRATELRRAHDLDAPARRHDGSDRSWRALQPGDAARLPDALPDDERGLYAVWGLRAHPLAQGDADRLALVEQRDTLARQHEARRERNAAITAQHVWDARAEVVRRAEAGTSSSDPDLVAEYRAWLAQTPRPSA